MLSGEEARRRFYVAAHHEDIPMIARGTLIPRTVPVRSRTIGFSGWFTRPVIMLTFSVLLFAVSLGTTGYSVVQGTMSMAAPIVYVQTEERFSPEPLHYGIEMSKTQPDFFKETHESFISNRVTFIEADLSSMTLAYYEDGNLVKEMEIVSKGREGSWWETPAGLYQIQFKKENHFSSFGRVYQPWSMAFQGNFFIHGWPYYPDGAPVPEGYSGGCIRLATEDAQELFEIVEVGTPVLVYEEDFASDGFLYEPKIPELNTPHYLIADIKSSTVLASSDLDTVAPIASLAKLMTALVAAEYIDLDATVRISQEKYVTTLIPRLQGNYSASMYSLLELLLVESSNEAAEVIATQLGRERFITLMNEKAKSLGLEDTVFTDPSGLDDGNVSTLADLLRLTQYIYHNRSFVFELTADHELETLYAGGQFGELMNFNEIDGVENFIGGKVGETLAAGQTSISLHTISVDDTERVVAIIILGSDNRPRDVEELLQYVDERFASE